MTIDNLLKLSPNEIRFWDIAIINLLCAQGLPGAEDLDIPKCLKILDEWTAHIRRETEKYLPTFHKHPWKADYSEAKYKIMMLGTVLYQDLHVDYNMQLVYSGIMANEQTTTFFRDSHDVFIHGLLTKKRMGSCSSMPVLGVAICRRLGYPVYLSSAKGHLMCIWDDGKERFNFDCAGQGISIHSDEHYKKWPKPITEEEYRSGIYLRPFIPAEELATFLCIRAMCLLEHRRFEEAIKATDRAVALRPNDPSAAMLAYNIKKQYNDFLAKQQQNHLKITAERMRADGDELGALLILDDPLFFELQRKKLYDNSIPVNGVSITPDPIGKNIGQPPYFPPHPIPQNQRNTLP